MQKSRFGMIPNIIFGTLFFDPLESRDPDAIGIRYVSRGRHCISGYISPKIHEKKTKPISILAALNQHEEI